MEIKCLAQGHNAMIWPGLEPVILRSPIHCLNHLTTTPKASGLPIQEAEGSSPNQDQTKPTDPLGPLAVIRNVSLATSHCAVTIATGPDQDNAQALFSIASSSGNIKVHQNIQGLTKDLRMTLCVSGVAMETGLSNTIRRLVGPVTFELDTAVQLLYSTLSVTKTVSHITFGHIPIILGQEHLNCLKILMTCYGDFLGLGKKVSVHGIVIGSIGTCDPPAQQAERKSSGSTVTPDPVHSKDDLRSGSFVYITDSESQEPQPNEIQFQPGGSGTNHDGTMTWQYPEPRVLTRITMTPIPLRTATNISDEDELSDVPCSLEYWDEMDCCFQHYKDLFVSETNTYHVSMGLGQRSIGSDGAVAACLWRMVLNPGSDKRKRNLLAEQNIILTPMALAASLRVDSCFSPVFIPTTSLALKFGLIDVHLVNHRSQLGQVVPEKLLPFTFDDAEPKDQEVCVMSLIESRISAQLWRVPSTALKTKLTMVPLIGSLPLEGSLMVDQADGGCLIEMDSSDINVRIGQGSLHTLTGALQSWMNNKQQEADRVVSAYYILSNNTNVTLRLGQVDTDEVIILPPRKMHQYCWRTHKQCRQLLHVGIDDSSYWSEPFDICREGITSPPLKHVGKEATLFVEVKALSPLQRQVLFHAKQSFVNHLTIPIEIHLQVSSDDPDQDEDQPIGSLRENGALYLEDALQIEGALNADTKLTGNPSQLEDAESRLGSEGRLQPEGNSNQFLPIDAESSHPSLVVDESDIVGVRVKLQGQESDWSEQFAIAGEMMREKFVIEVPRPNKSSIYFCCSILEETHDGKTQRAILFSPSFWINNLLPHSLIMNLTCRKNPGVQTKEIQGCGAMTPLYHLNPPRLLCNIPTDFFSLHLFCFYSSETSPSNPAIPVSFDSDVFVVLSKEPLNISDLIFPSTQRKSRNSWLFEIPEFGQSNSSSQKEDPIISQPNTDLNIHLSQDWSHVDSVVINVEPWCLVANETEWDVTISDAGGRNCHIPAGTVIAPPKIQGNFTLSVVHKETESSSEMVSLVDEKISPFLRPDQMEKKQLFIDSYVSLEIPFSSEGSKDVEVYHFVVQSEIKEKLRFMKIQPKVVICNDYESSLTVKAVEIGGTEKVSKDRLKNLERKVIGPNSTSSSVVWKRFGPSAANLRQSPWKQSISVTLTDRNWSKWVHVDTACARQPIPVPIEACGVMQFATLPFVAVMHEERGVIYVSLAIDPCPRMVITNNCSFPLHLGQAEPGKASKGSKVIEDGRFLPECNIVPPQQMAHYSYHSSTDTSEPVRICLAVAPYFSAVQLPGKNGIAGGDSEPDWTDPIAIATTSSPISEITALSTGSYVLVASHVTGSQTNINVELLSMESSTSEKSDEETKTKTEGCESSTRVVTPFQQVKVKLHLKSVTLSLMDELQSPVKFVEALRLHAKGINLLSHPVPHKDRKGQLQTFTVSVRSAQVDNQAHASGRYDFPVLFKGKSGTVSAKKEVDHTDFAESSENLRRDSFVVVHVSTEFTEEGRAFGWQDVSVHINHAEVFIEDQFIFDTLHFCRSFPAVALRYRGARGNRDRLPGNVRASLTALRGPISIQQLTVEPIRVLASVHASMKFFVAVDRTLLTFGQFETGPVFATVSQLGQALSLHYTSGAIFKAGWVLGSLEILGNPAGLLRSVSSGLADTILLPYEGLIRGPTAFISGVAGGLSSLVWQVTAGALTSVTTFATSVSRNLDRLSLDQDHLVRQETARRRIPHGPTEGITQGLSHFGISLLGAIAGIADQPIRGFQRAGNAGEGYRGDQAREVISGLGKGLVGAVVKPIGGAAELVSQTGQGILHGTGLAEVSKRVSMQHVELRAKFPNAQVKYAWKMLLNLPNPEIIFMSKVTSITHHGLHHSGALVLTPEVLFLIGVSEDSHQQAFPLDQTQCFPLRESDEGLRFVVRGASTPITSPEVPETSDLIADFVDVSSSFVGSTDELTNTTSVGVVPESPTSSADSWTFTFFMNCHVRTTFISIFDKTKRQLPGESYLPKNF
ncbi:putative vacuolar protein sorting-associated protein 13B isoform X1 [Apostichopus japonicus]|uniref:Putative vacuolar protein sorting-associated protein 13B isoform X1 n=1 Tax=Stichopus japonicus TaxID=307972 RepID=A0A2G8JY07_STIJA|nr:putative vacuolar protein sorting-associated protein 13B isoform X1 [Apostichopus japonicus]